MRFWSYLVLMMTARSALGPAFGMRRVFGSAAVYRRLACTATSVPSKKAKRRKFEIFTSTSTEDAFYGCRDLASPEVIEVIVVDIFPGRPQIDEPLAC